MKIASLHPSDLTKTNKCARMDEAGPAHILQVTKISGGIKNQNRANIHVNNTFAFSLTIAQLADVKLKVGQTLTPEQLDHLKQTSTLGKLYSRTLSWVLLRPRSIQEVRDYLRRKELARDYSICHHAASSNVRQARVENYNTHSPHDGAPTAKTWGKAVGCPACLVRSSEDETECCNFDSARRRGCSKQHDDILNSLISKGFLNDEKFTHLYIETRRQKKGISQKRLEMELRQKGIAPEIIAEALSTTPRTDQTEITKIITKKRPKYTDQQLIQYLTRQGFDYQSAKTAVLETDSQNSA